MSSKGESLRFDGRTAIITGAGRGIGREHALLLARRGANIVVNDLGLASSTTTGGSQSPATDVVAEIVAAGGKAVADFGDISSEVGARDLVERAMDIFGQVDIVINNAGIAIHQKLEALEWEGFELMLLNHIGGSFLVTQAAWPHMKARGYGRVVMTGSNAALWGQSANHDYCAAKGGVMGLTRSLSRDGATHGILVNCLCPRAATRLADNIENEKLRFDFKAKLLPELIAPLAAYLAHEDCKLTGEIFDVGGGLVRRVLVAVGRGYTASRLTPEAVRDNFDSVMAEDGYQIPTLNWDIVLGPMKKYIKPSDASF